MKKENVLSPVKKISLSEQVADKLRQAIVNGRIKPGERLIEEQVAALMKSSRGPVRDAFLILEREGLVSGEQNRGTAVTTMSAEDIGEVWSLRLALESLALQYTIERIKAKELEAMEKITDDISICVKSRLPLGRAVDLDLKFHECLVNASGHKRLISWWKELRSQIWFVIFSGNIEHTGGFPKEAGIWHRKIVEVIRHKKLDEGIGLLKKHLEHSNLSLKKRYLTITERENNVKNIKRRKRNEAR
ncbi:MAG: GntR family transcriptional regulator [Candidatus Omnitrophota bacterium]